MEWEQRTSAVNTIQLADTLVFGLREREREFAANSSDVAANRMQCAGAAALLLAPLCLASLEHLFSCCITMGT